MTKGSHNTCDHKYRKKEKKIEVIQMSNTIGLVFMHRAIALVMWCGHGKSPVKRMSSLHKWHQL